MKKFNFIYKSLILILAAFFVACEVDSFSEEDQYILGDINAPTSIAITSQIVGQSTEKPNGDGSGTVHFTVTAENALSYKFVFDGKETVSPTGKVTYNFSVNGTNTYVVTAVALGAGGTTTSLATELTVFASYKPSAEFLQKLHGASSKKWRLEKETGGYVGVGPDWQTWPEWYSAAPNSRTKEGSDDDTWTIRKDGTFTHTTNGGCAVKTEWADEVGGVKDLADNTYFNFAIADYDGTWEIIAPGGVESIQLSGIGHFGLYTGTHVYSWKFTGDNKAELTTVDSFGRRWWFKLIAD